MSRFDVRRLRSRDELTAFGKDLAAEIKADDVPSLAAAVAFKIVLALFPSLVAAIGIFGLVTDPQDLSRLLDSLGGVVPAGVVDFLEQPLQDLIDAQTAGGIAAVVGVVGGLWAASSAAATLNKSLTRAYDRTEGRRLVTMRAAALAVTVALLIALIGIFVLLVAGGRIEDNVLASLPLTATARAAIDVGVTIVRYLLAAGALMLLFAFIYWMGPDYEHRPPYAWITPGAALGVVTWLVASGLFGLYAGISGNYRGSGSIYGSLGSAILFMLWLQLSMFALLLGAEVNQVLQLRASARTSSAEVAGFGGEPATQLAPTPRPAGQRSYDSGRSDDGEAAGTQATTPPRAPYPSGPRTSHPSTHGRAVDVRAHPDAGDGPHDGSGAVARRPGAGPRAVPRATLVGAIVAGVSSALGLAGVLRRRRDG